MGVVGPIDIEALSGVGQAGTPAVSPGDDASNPLHAAMV